MIQYFKITYIRLVITFYYALILKQMNKTYFNNKIAYHMMNFVVYLIIDNKI